MIILHSAALELPVPPKLDGGIERVVDLLVIGLQTLAIKPCGGRKWFRMLTTRWRTKGWKPLYTKLPKDE